MNKTIIVLPDASVYEIEAFHKALKRPGVNPIVINKEIKVFHNINGEMFEVVSSLKKIK